MQLSTDPAVHGFRANFADQVTHALAAPLTFVAFLKIMIPTIAVSVLSLTWPSASVLALGFLPLLYQLSHFAIRLDGRNRTAKVIYAITMPAMLYFGVTFWRAASTTPTRIPALPVLHKLPAWMTQMVAAMVVLSVLFSVVSLASSRREK